MRIAVSLRRKSVIVLDWCKSRYAWLAEFFFITSSGLPPSGFIVASPGHPIASAWLARIKAHWSKSYAERPDLEYLWVNKLFRQLVGTEAEGGDLQARAIWDKVPKISCEHGKKGPMRFLQLVLSNISFRFAWSHHDKGADNVDKGPVSKLIIPCLAWAWFLGAHVGVMQFFLAFPGLFVLKLFGRLLATSGFYSGPEALSRGDRLFELMLAPATSELIEEAWQHSHSSSAGGHGTCDQSESSRKIISVEAQKDWHREQKKIISFWQLDYLADECSSKLQSTVWRCHSDSQWFYSTFIWIWIYIPPSHLQLIFLTTLRWKAIERLPCGSWPFESSWRRIQLIGTC